MRTKIKRGKTACPGATSAAGSDGLGWLREGGWRKEGSVTSRQGRRNRANQAERARESVLLSLLRSVPTIQAGGRWSSAGEPLSVGDSTDEGGRPETLAALLND